MYKIITKTEYEITKTFIIRDNGNGSFTSFLADPDNTDYQTYLKWVAEGNVAEPAEVTA